MILLKHFVFNELGVNSFILHDPTRECIIIDPGCNTNKQRQDLLDYINENNLKPVMIASTHGHFDHVLGNGWLKSIYNCPLVMHHDDLNLIEHIDKYAGMFGYAIEKAPIPDQFLTDGQWIGFGESKLKVIHVPGHSPGSICLYAEEDHLLICGDVIFYGSIGRTDLPGGNHQLLLQGIRSKLLGLPPDTIVWPGHGPKTTIRHEHDTNPFLN